MQEMEVECGLRTHLRMYDRCTCVWVCACMRMCACGNACLHLFPESPGLSSGRGGERTALLIRSLPPCSVAALTRCSSLVALSAPLHPPSLTCFSPSGIYSLFFFPTLIFLTPSAVHPTPKNLKTVITAPGGPLTSLPAVCCQQYK